MTAIWINGEMTTPDEARISAFDAGIQHGVGQLETFPCIRFGRDEISRRVFG